MTSAQIGHVVSFASTFFSSTLKPGMAPAIAANPPGGTTALRRSMLSRGSRLSKPRSASSKSWYATCSLNSLCFSARACALTTSFRTLGGMSDALSARNSNWCCLLSSTCARVRRAPPAERPARDISCLTRVRFAARVAKISAWSRRARSRNAQHSASASNCAVRHSRHQSRSAGVMRRTSKEPGRPNVDLYGVYVRPGPGSVRETPASFAARPLLVATPAFVRDATQSFATQSSCRIRKSPLARRTRRRHPPSRRRRRQTRTPRRRRRRSRRRAGTRRRRWNPKVPRWTRRTRAPTSPHRARSRAPRASRAPEAARGDEARGAQAVGERVGGTIGGTERGAGAGGALRGVERVEDARHHLFREFPPREP